MFSGSGSIRGMFDLRSRSKLGFSASSEDTFDAPSTPRDPSTTQMSDYTVALQTKPSSTFERPSTPVPHWPLPTLQNENPQSAPLRKIKEVRPCASNASLSGKDAQPRSPKLTSGYSSITGRFTATPSLPPAWTVVHDRAICVLDSCEYSLEAAIKKLRSAFPELGESVLTPVMIDKRLRTLDQNPNVDYFRIGLEHVLTRNDNDTDDENSSVVSKSENKTLMDRRNAVPSIPSFSSVSTGRQNSGFSIDESLRDEDPKKQTPESKRSTASSRTSKIPRPISTSVVRSHPFETGFMSYRTTLCEEEAPTRSSTGVMEPVRSR